MAEQGFTLLSPDFESGASIPRAYTCDGADKPPRLHWMHAPQGTRSFALIVDDPDAPRGTFTHWLLFDVPVSVSELQTATGHVGIAGKNDFQHDAYGGPCPPAGHGEHRYFFKLYALDIDSLNLPTGARRDEVETAMAGHVLDQTELVGCYERGRGGHRR